MSDVCQNYFHSWPSPFLCIRSFCWIHSIFEFCGFGRSPQTPKNFKTVPPVFAEGCSPGVLGMCEASRAPRWVQAGNPWHFKAFWVLAFLEGCCCSDQVLDCNFVLCGFQKGIMDRGLQNVLYELASGSAFSNSRVILVDVFHSYPQSLGLTLVCTYMLLSELLGLPVLPNCLFWLFIIQGLW